MKPREKEPSISPTQLEMTKAMLSAAAQITSAMVTVTTEKNPAKICEAFRVIYKAIADTANPSPRKPA
ncbi:MAG: hypothetical protein IPK13_18630 [Deltaproteobacteria bacterium]|nr:hypothetical protein [Deltaproteobacteria bacterium]